MKNKITLITPPDIFENSNISILFVHLTDQEQDLASSWLSNSNFAEPLNLYVYSGEPNVSWLLYAASRCEYKYIDLDEITGQQHMVMQALQGYLIGNNNFFYKTVDENIAAVYSHISANRINGITEFLENTLSVKTT